MTPVSRANTLFDRLSSEVFYEFNLRTVLLLLALKDPKTFDTFERVVHEAGEIRERVAARIGEDLKELLPCQGQN